MARELPINIRIEIAEHELDSYLVPVAQFTSRLAAEHAVLVTKGLADNVRELVQKNIDNIRLDLEAFQTRANAAQSALDALYEERDILAALEAAELEGKNGN